MYQAAETKEKVDTLKTDNKRLEDKIEVLGQEMKFLKDIFIAHASGSAPSPAAGAASGRGGSSLALLLSCSIALLLSCSLALLLYSSIALLLSCSRRSLSYSFPSSPGADGGPPPPQVAPSEPPVKNEVRTIDVLQLILSNTSYFGSLTVTNKSPISRMMLSLICCQSWTLDLELPRF